MAPTLAAHQPHSALVVDADPLFVSELAPIVTASGFRVLPLSDFTAARHELYACRPEVLVANLRLGAFNGIHLAYLAKINNPETRAMIYGEDDRMLAGEVQSAGAFYERSAFVRYALAAFLRAPLPTGIVARSMSPIVASCSAADGGRPTSRSFPRPQLLRAHFK